MNKLTKSDLGLGEVRNRLNPSMLEYDIINKKLDNVLLNKEINGNLSTLDSEPTVIKDNTGAFPILKLNLEGVNKVKVTVDTDDAHFQLTNATEGKSIYFEFVNLGDYDIQWMNLRVKDGMSPGLSPKQPDQTSARTIYEITKLGSEYYLINEIHGV